MCNFSWSLIWLQWKLPNMNNIGTKVTVLISGVSLFQWGGRIMEHLSEATNLAERVLSWQGVR